MWNLRLNRLAPLTTAVVLSAFLSGPAASAVHFTEVATIEAPPFLGPHTFGVDVRVSADGNAALIISSPCWIANYIFVRSGSTWTKQQKLAKPNDAAPDCSPEGTRGSLSGDGTTALIVDSEKGAAYAYIRSGTTWGVPVKLTVLGGLNTGGGQAGASALSGDGHTALLGATGNDCANKPKCGAAYVFVRNGAMWSLPQKLANPSPTAFHFGSALALAGDGQTALVGSQHSLLGAKPAVGDAYVFVRNGSTWSFQQKLVASDPQESAIFGNNVALSENGNIALVAARGQSCGAGTSCGAVYAFFRHSSTWTQQQKLLGPNVDNAQFGRLISLSANGTVALVGAPQDICANGNTCGSIYVFRRTVAGWNQAQKLQRNGSYSGVGLSGNAYLALAGGPANVVFVFAALHVFRPPGFINAASLSPRKHSRPRG